MVSAPTLPTPGVSPGGQIIDPDARVDITDPDQILDRLRSSVGELWAGFLEQLPLLVLAVLVLVVGLLLVGVVHRLVVRATDTQRLDVAVVKLIQTGARLAMVLIVLLVALSVAGVNVGSALAALGIVGLAIAFAMQSILENFIAGMLILARRPFRAGDQVRLGDFEGTVTDVNMRVTTLNTYDGEKVLVPNATVFNEPITNTTEQGRRRTTVVVGVDYRNDHDRAREVLSAAVQSVDGVLPIPPARVLLTDLGDSSVDFRLQFWTLPEQAQVTSVRDRVLGAAKRAIEDEGMTIPWPIRTLVVDPDSAGMLSRSRDEQ